ncbi:unnamed protein product [Alopecurus aequalis]
MDPPADMDLAPGPSPLCPDLQNNTDYTLRIAGLVVVAVVAMFLLHVLGSLRRRSSDGFLHAIVMATYTLSYALVSYTIGLMQSSGWYYDEFTFGPGTGYQAPLWAILFVVLLKSHVRITSMRMASRSYLLSKEVKAITDYMHHEHEDQLLQYDPVTMKGYRYVVTGESRQKYEVKRPEYMLRHKEDRMKITTVEQVWQCTGSLLHHDPRFKDVCLSMALSKMLNRRFGGFELAEAVLPKTHDLVFRGLLVGDAPHERAFRVIEVELAFVHDLYYTRYPYLYQSGRFMALYVPFLMVGLCSWLIRVIFKQFKVGSGRYFNKGATLFIMVLVVFMEVFQLYLYIASGWFKVSLIKKYVTTPLLHRSGCLVHMIMGFLLRLEAIGSWEGKLGQYSFLSSFNKKSRFINCLHYLTMRLVDKGKEGRKREKLVKVSMQVKQAIVGSLVESNGKLTNGVHYLRKKPATVSAVHTAASEVALTLSEEDIRAVDTDSAVASSLSRYCAYLVAFASNLLPDHSSGSSLILAESIKEARKLLGGCRSMESKCQKLMEIAADDGHGVDAPLVLLGARLARNLMEDIHEPTLRWKVLSDFWAEMMLYVAPSDDALAHLEALAKGGEFITHLWALLTHAGILKQPITGSPGDV